MNGVFLYTNIDSNKEFSGEAKKALMQVNALKELGHSVKLIDVDKSSKITKLTNRIPLFPIYNNIIINQLKREVEDIDYIYIRKYIIDKSFIKILKTIKEANNDLIVILEIPTYPYDLEWKRLIDKPILIKEKINRMHMKRYVDYIVTFSKDEEIFGIKTIKLNNGIDPQKIKIRSINRNKEDKEINLVGIALLAKWHGYDRLIEGLYEYYKHKKEIQVNFYIVGEGSELNNLKRIVKKYQMEKYIHFTGRLHSKELDDMYDMADIAIGSLGMYRIGMEEGYTLKLREYCAKGIPLIKGYYDEVFDKNAFRYMLTFSNDDTPIDIDKIVDFYFDIRKKDIAIISEEIRKFAIENLTWKAQMQKIIDIIDK